MTMEQKFDALVAFVLAEEPEVKETARKALNAVIRPEKNTFIPDVSADDVVHRFLTEIGAQPHLIGYKYCVYGILQTIAHLEYLDSITGRFYPMIAIKFDTTASRVERAIRNLIERIWLVGDMDTLERYFGTSICNDKGKPTNSHFIARCAIIVNSKLRN